MIVQCKHYNSFELYIWLKLDWRSIGGASVASFAPALCCTIIVREERVANHGWFERADQTVEQQQQRETSSTIVTPALSLHVL